MMMRSKFFVAVFLSSSLISCSKYLDEKPRSNLAVPSSVRDLQLLLDNYIIMNNQYPDLLGIISDDYYLTSTDLGNLTNTTQQNSYLWKRDLNTGDYWSACYTTVFNCNTVLDHGKKIDYTPDEQDELSNAIGSALFLRAFYFYGLAQLYGQPYIEASAESDLGIPLRLTADFNDPSSRSTVKQTYDQIINDYKEAARLLPDLPTIKSRPSKAAAYGAIARTYLTMGNYNLAKAYSDSCLNIYSILLDYNDDSKVLVATNIPFARFNEEVIFQMLSGRPLILATSRAKIDSTLFRSYDDSDIRKQAFFRSNNNNTYRFKGDYDGQGNNFRGVFAGIVTDEIYLTRAECFARAGKIVEAMQDLNTLMEKRWKLGTYIPYTATDQQDALAKILQERRKELIFRGSRWSDLRRLMNDPISRVIPKRDVGGTIHELLPNSLNYSIPIPQIVIDRTGLLQNP